MGGLPEERAAIREYDSRQSLEDAEVSAARDIGSPLSDLQRLTARELKGEHEKLPLILLSEIYKL